MNYQISIAENEIILNKKIIDLAFRIKNEFPRLSTFMHEMPSTLPGDENAEVNVETLNNYYESLFKFLAFFKCEMTENKMLD